MKQTIAADMERQINKTPVVQKQSEKDLTVTKQSLGKQQQPVKESAPVNADSWSEE